MREFRRSRGLIAFLIAGLATACNSGNTQSLPSTVSADNANGRAGGGVFSATSSGRYRFADCGMRATGAIVAPTSADGHLRFRGKGDASYLHFVIESGTMTGKPSGSRCVWSGSATLKSKHRQSNSVTFSLGLNGSPYHNPCDEAVGYVITGGTGKFANASGYGTVTLNCTDSGYSDVWSGTLTY